MIARHGGTKSFSIPAMRPEIAASLAPGARLGRYVIVEPLASGGMGHVFIAHAPEEPRTLYAVKTVRADLATDAEFRTMFLREATLAASVRHANVVPVLECGEDGGLLYEVMPLVEGDSIDGLLKRRERTGSGRALPVGVVVRTGIDALRGLHAAHETTDAEGHLLGLIHRDVSPQNILVDVRGSARLTDFGIAKAVYVMNDATATGELKGKLAYLSPEQVAGQTIDRRADLFSMGIVLWEALTGKRLFRGDDPFATMRKIRELDVPDPRRFCAECPPELGQVLATALQRRPGRRYPSARHMADALEAVASQLGDEASHARVAALVGSLVHEDLEARRANLAAHEASVGEATERIGARMWNRRLPVAVTVFLAVASAGLIAILVLPGLRRPATRSSSQSSETAPANTTAAEPPRAPPAPSSAKATVTAPTPSNEPGPSTEPAASSPTTASTAPPSATHRVRPPRPTPASSASTKRSLPFEEFPKDP